MIYENVHSLMHLTVLGIIRSINACRNIQIYISFFIYYYYFFLIFGNSFVYLLIHIFILVLLKLDVLF